MTMAPRCFEQAVEELEGICLIIRVPGNGATLSAYDYQRKCADSVLVRTFIEARIKPLLDGYEFSIIDPVYMRAGYPSPNLTMGELRKRVTYAVNYPGKI